MIKRLSFMAALILPLLLAAPYARAENDQTVVIGIGGGGYTVEEDEIHGDRTMMLSHLYLEWYALGSLGFGLRRTVMLETGAPLLLVFGGIEVFSAQSNMVTVNWIVLGSQSYARLGLVAGAGNAKYEYDGVLLFGVVERHVKTSGSATLGGIFLDWGGDGFGARLGYDAVSTKLDDVDVPGVGMVKADASGSAAYLDLRWAF